jgi:hypothetical protein
MVRHVWFLKIKDRNFKYLDGINVSKIRKTYVLVQTTLPAMSVTIFRSRSYSF